MVKKSAKTSLLVISIVAILFCVFGCSEEQSDIAAKAELINTDNIRLREELDQCREKNKQLMEKSQENFQNIFSGILTVSAEENNKLKKEIAELKKKLAEANK
ncbi:MAG: hypothetical protein ACYTBP_07105 [Planctomycetota bacterium]|jgi:hypothetical protein